MTTAMLANNASVPEAAAPADATAVPRPASRPRRRPNPFASTRVQSLLLLVVLLGAWEGAVRLFKVSANLVPPVSDIAVALWRGLATGPMAKDGFWYHGGVTVAEILLGFLIGSGVGLAIGIVVSQMPRVEALLEPYVAALQSVPKVAIAPIIVVWLGFGIGSKVMIICLLTFFPVLVTSIAGFKAVDADRIDLLRSLSATRWQIFRKAKFPSALPYIFAGLNMAAAFSVVGAVVGEFVGAQAGLGVLILQMEAQADTGGSFAVCVVLSVIGIVMTDVLRRIQRRVLHWMPADTSQRTVSV